MDMQPLTKKQRDFAIENHNLVYDFLNKKKLPESVFYDVVIFGYLRAVQEYCDRPSLHEHHFSTIAWKRMRSSLSNYYKYLSRPKRNAPTVSLDEPIGSENGLLWADVVCGQDALMMELESELMLHMLAASLPSREMRIIRMKIRGDRMHDIAKAEHLTFQQINTLLSSIYPTVSRIICG